MLFAKIKNIFINPIVLQFKNSNISDLGRIRVPKNFRRQIQNYITTKERKVFLPVDGIERTEKISF